MDRLEPEHLELAVAREELQAHAVGEGAGAAARPPLLVGGQIVHVAELDVAHPGSLGDRDRDGVGSEGALRVPRAVDRIDHHAHRPAAGQRHLAALLRDHGQPDAERLELGEDRLLREPVDHQRGVAAHAAPGR